jgi:murein DD-endopeptidase MepM/ murein hydrolase activator NlpD
MSSSVKTALWGLIIASVVGQVLLWTTTSFDNDPAIASAATSAVEVSTVAETHSATESAMAQMNQVIIPSLALTEYTVRSGDTLSTIWKKIGGPSKSLQNLIKALGTVGITAKSLRVGETLKYAKNADGDIIELHKTLKKPDSVLIKGNSSEGYSAILNTPKVITTEKPVTGTITRSLSESATALNVPYEVIDAYVDLFSSRVEFRRDMQPGDEFTIIYEEKRLEDGDFIGVGDIKLASLKVSGDTMAAVRLQSADGQWRYYDELGENLAQTFLRYPLSFSRISSVFSTSRFHPVLKRRRPHNGVDFAAPTGTPVRTVADGVVTFSGWSGGGGKTIKINHGSRYATAYLHLSQINANVRKGTKVKRGQLIGKVGATGLASGPHLHFGFYDRGRYVDPLAIKLPRMDEGPGSKASKEALASALLKLEQLSPKSSATVSNADATTLSNS